MATVTHYSNAGKLLLLKKRQKKAWKHWPKVKALSNIASCPFFKLFEAFKIRPTISKESTLKGWHFCNLLARWIPSCFSQNFTFSQCSQFLTTDWSEMPQKKQHSIFTIFYWSKTPKFDEARSKTDTNVQQADSFQNHRPKCDFWGPEFKYPQTIYKSCKGVSIPICDIF